MIKKYKDIQKDFEFLMENGNPKGNSTGFETLDEYYTIKYGSYTIILAAPHSGKSEFGFEMCLNQALHYGKRSLIYSPETGSVADIYAELIQKYAGKPVFQKLKYALSEKEIYQAIAFIDEYFTIIDADDKGYTYYDIMGMRTNEDLIFVDPNNEVIHNYVDRQDTYIEIVTADIRRFCKKNNVHMIITMHPAHQQAITDKETGKSYFGMPTARMAAGGQAWFRKAMGWINLWLPPDGFNSPDGHPYPENSVLVNIEKAKPKGIGKKGTLMLMWDYKKSRYFEESLNGTDFFYAFDYEKGISYKNPDEISYSAMQPSLEFESNVMDDNLPF